MRDLSDQGSVRIDLTELAEHLASLQPSAGDVRLVAIDGHSGSGKSTLARALAKIMDAPVAGLEDMYPGWDGLVAGVHIAKEGVVDRFSAGRSARWTS